MSTSKTGLDISQSGAAGYMVVYTMGYFPALLPVMLFLVRQAF
jgi:hypothetical protein